MSKLYKYGNIYKTQYDVCNNKQLIVKNVIYKINILFLNN